MVSSDSDFFSRYIVDHAPCESQSTCRSYELQIFQRPFTSLILALSCSCFRLGQIRFPDGTDVWWFGGGQDLSPITIDMDDGRHFHSQLNNRMAAHRPYLYPAMKRWADRYFFLDTHQETRGIGGIFFDDLHTGSKLHLNTTRHAPHFHPPLMGQPLPPHVETEPKLVSCDMSADEIYQFVETCAFTFSPSYFPLVQRHHNEPYTEEDVKFQRFRRGRYAMFNLIYDEGTRYGLVARPPPDRIEVILSSLPTQCEFPFKPQWRRAEELRTIEILHDPIEWV